MKDLEIKKNEYTGGQNCVFEHNGKWYYADKSYVPFCGIETMIFQYDKEKEEVIDWSDLYCDRSLKSLEQCIEEFISQQQ